MPRGSSGIWPGWSNDSRRQVRPGRDRVKLVLVGAGHAHLAVIRQAASLRAAGLEPILIAPPTFDYSGLASGVLSGALSACEARIDVAALARRYGLPHRAGEVVRVDRDQRRLTLADGSLQDYDAASFNIGSEVADPGRWIGDEGVWPVKPLSSLLALRSTLEAGFARGDATPRIVVLGDGPTAFEIAAAVTGLHERNQRQARLTLVGPNPSIDWVPGSAANSLARNLDRRGVTRVVARGLAYREGCLHLSNGQCEPVDHLILATGLRAPALMRGLRLGLDPLGRVVVRPSLASVADPRLFAVGDCATVMGAPRPFAGVFGVRAASSLLQSLCALASDRREGAYRPQSRWLSILDLGDGTAMAHRGGVWWRGRSALALKRRLDLGFVRGHRA